MPAPHSTKLHSDFEVLLENSNEKPVHQCIELLMIEVYKYLNGLSPDVMSDIFKLTENTYNLRNFHIFESQNPRTKMHVEIVNFGKKFLRKL